MTRNASLDHVLVTCYTDPVCTWCWGMEPVFRKLETHYGDQLRFEYVLGGLVKDYRDRIEGPDAGSEESAQMFNRRLAERMGLACGKHGMPVDVKGFHLFSPDHPSTHPQSVACEAARLAAPARFQEYLYRMRLATAAQARVTSRRTVQVELADASGIDVTTFLERLDDGSARQAFRDDRDRIVEAGVTGYPTFEITYGEAGVTMSGYRSYEVFSALIGSLTDNAVRPHVPRQTYDAILDYMDAHPIMTIAELAAAYDFNTKADALAFVQPLCDDEILDLQPAGNGFTVEKPRVIELDVEAC